MSDHAESLRVVEVEIDVKVWTKSLPAAHLVRPGRCLGCGAAGVEASGRVVLHGHGVRWRAWWGPPEADGTPAKDRVAQRRYGCQRCRAVVVVRPRGVLRGRRYSAAAMAWALWLWADALLTDLEVRKRVSIRPEPGPSRPERWTTLRRWAKAVREGELWRMVQVQDDWSLRQCAQRAATVVSARGDPSLLAGARAFAGASHAR